MTADVSEIQKQAAIEQHSRQADQFADRYRVPETDAFRSCFTYSRRRLAAWLERSLPDPAAGLRLLDVGCGTGHHLAQLRARGFEVAGVDGSAEMLDYARALNPGSDIQQSDVEHLPFPDASFDVVLCIEVLRYLPCPARCVAEMARVLRPGGFCLATATPLFSLNGYWAINRVATLVPLGNLVRLKQYFSTTRRLRRTFRSAGFRPEVETHGVYLGPINWLERLAPWLLPRFLRAWEPLDGMVADLPLVREVSNMFLVKAVRST
jgi:ubiquinone/menaquinone biosynthesis C-methylase UbiE